MKKIEKNLPSPIEQQLGLEFGPVDKKALNILNKQIRIISSFLGKDTPEIKTPKKGFLLKPLTTEQKKSIDQILGPIYAEIGVNLQDQLTSIPIKENMEPMQNIPDYFNSLNIPISLSKLPFNPACGKWANKPRIFWARKGIVQRLANAGKAMEKVGLMLHLEDGFRPVGVQEGLFFRRIKLILEEHPDWINNWEKVWIEARSKTAVCPSMAGHKAGTAVDITLQTLDGEKLQLGNSYPEGGPRVSLHFPYLTQQEWTTRMLFAYTMELSGLRIYPYENWHASHGDLSAAFTFGEKVAITKKYTTKYGPIKDFDPKTGEVVPYHPDEYTKPFFSKEELLKAIRKK